MSRVGSEEESGMSKRCPSCGWTHPEGAVGCPNERDEASKKWVEFIPCGNVEETIMTLRAEVAALESQLAQRDEDALSVLPALEGYDIECLAGKVTIYKLYDNKLFRQVSREDTLRDALRAAGLLPPKQEATNDPR